MYPWISHANHWMELEPNLKTDFDCALKIECELSGIDWTLGDRPHPQMMNTFCYRWLAEKGYHELRRERKEERKEDRFVDIRSGY
jgi:hypothetical protein